jgi:hypothetical protein
LCKSECFKILAWQVICWWNYYPSSLLDLLF